MFEQVLPASTNEVNDASIEFGIETGERHYFINKRKPQIRK